MYVYISRSLSLSIYIYIHMYVCMCVYIYIYKWPKTLPPPLEKITSEASSKVFPLGGVVRFRAVVAEHVTLRPCGQQLLKLFCSWDRESLEHTCTITFTTDIVLLLLFLLLLLLLSSSSSSSLSVLSLLLSLLPSWFLSLFNIDFGWDFTN